MTAAEHTDWRGRNVRIFPGWDVLRRAPFVEGHVVSLRPAMWVVRDAEGVEQEWPVTLPIEEASHLHNWVDISTHGDGKVLRELCGVCSAQRESLR